MGQKENYVWKFGNGLGIDFNTCPPTQLYEGAYTTEENSCAISDPNTGKLLFYTNNVGVYDKNDQLMPNGSIFYSSIGASQSVSQITIVPHPNKDSSFMYFIFSCQPQSLSNEPLLYHVVDMRKNGGLGDVVINKAYLHAGPMNEMVTAIRAPDRKSFRVIFHGYMSDVFYTYKIDESGLNLTPVETKIGKVINQPCPIGIANIGSLSASPDGKYIAYAHYCDKDFQLFKFDYSSGILYDYVNIQNSSHPNTNNTAGYYGSCFSPNSQLFYITTGQGGLNSACDLLQYSLSSWTANDIELTKYVVKHLKDSLINRTTFRRQFGHLKNGPDGKLYIAISYQGFPKSNQINYYDSIDYCLPALHYPDKIGPACEYTDCEIKFNPASNGKSYTQFNYIFPVLMSWCLNNLYEMPIQPRTKQRIRGETKAIHCQQTLLAPISKPGEPVLKTVWSDQYSKVPRYRNQESGTLWVDQETDCYIYRDSFILDKQKPISGKAFSDCIQPNGLDIQFLSDTSEFRSFKWNDKDSSETAGIHVSKANTYLLNITRNCDIITDTFRIRNQTRSIGSKLNLCIGNGQNLKPLSRSSIYNQFLWSNGGHSDSLLASKSGTYWVDAISKCDTIRDSFVVVDRKNIKGLSKDFCPGDDIWAISEIQGLHQTIWNNGSTLDTLKQASEGTYWVESITDCEIIRDSIKVAPVHVSIPNLSNDTSICGRSLLYRLPIDTNVYFVRWKNGTQGAAIELKLRQDYLFKVHTKLGCLWDSGRISLHNLPNHPVYFENSFTPNGDEHNEVFPSFQFDDVERIESIEVYSRWGDLIFSGAQQRWDGTFDGEPCQDGIYLCRIVFRNCDFTRSYFSGMITLLR